jgi:DNA polymerase III epsilon subunit-like protein
MNYIVFDLEFNQEFSFNKEKTEKKKSKCPFEIIDIGAVKLDEDLNTVGTFDQLVKPAVHKRLHPFVKRMTGITRESLKNAKPFEEVYKEFSEFLSDVQVLCVWGTADIKELIKNIEYHKLDTSVVPREFINVQQYASKLLQAPGSGSVGLGNAAKLLDINVDTELHKAFNDAYYTAEVFKKINNEDIKPKLYNFTEDTKPKRERSKKTALDTKALIAQFEKMFKREMTTEEKAIIKLAYKMGNTNQFLRNEGREADGKV